MDPMLRPEHEAIQQIAAGFRTAFDGRAAKYTRAAGLLGLLPLEVRRRKAAVNKSGRRPAWTGLVQDGSRER